MINQNMDGMSSDKDSFQENAWLDLMPHAVLSRCKAFPRLAKDQQIPWLVVGAGFTGVAAARRLAERLPDERIFLVDANSIGDCSSSRSSGFVVSLGHFGNSIQKNNHRLFRLGTAGLESLRRSVQVHEIHCGWDEQSRLIGAMGGPGLRALKRIKAVLDSVGSQHVNLDQKQIQNLTGMVGYLAAIRQDDSVLVNPASLLSGLILNLPSNVEVYANSPVSCVRRGKGIITCGHATLSVGRVLFATNAQAPELGLARNRVIPMRTYISAASRTDADSKQAMSGENWGITSSQRVGSSLRRASNQIMIRSSAFYGPRPNHLESKEIERVASVQRAALLRRFPGQQWNINKTWPGAISVTANGGQLFGRVNERTFISTGYNGHGIAQGTVSGHLLADLAMGFESSLLNDIQGLPQPNWIPPGFLLRTGVKAYTKLLEWQLRDEI